MLKKMWKCLWDKINVKIILYLFKINFLFLFFYINVCFFDENKNNWGVIVRILFDLWLCK